ncbi:MAG: hypothetical protein LAC69_08150 [Chlorobium sp.]|jgi:hypothetical protein|nr:hypothetical protein [Chlorobium sp.]
MTLRELVAAHDSDGFFLAIAKNDFALCEPDFLFFDDDRDKTYGDTEMRKLKNADYFDTAVPEEAEYASDWVITDNNNTRYRIKLFF